MELDKKTVKQESGFALLMTLIVVGVVVAIGLSVLDLSLKQVRLSTNTKDSEIAFHAANAGMECARYWRRAASTSMDLGRNIPDVSRGIPAISCFSTTLPTEAPQTYSAGEEGITGDGEVYVYEYQFTWGTSPAQRCSKITSLVASTSALGADLVIGGVEDLVVGYPEDSKTCLSGERCTILSVKGYNKPCNSIDGFGTVEREVLLQF